MWILIITKMHFLPLNQDISAHHFVFAAFDEEERLQLVHHFAPILYILLYCSLLTSSAITTCPLSSSAFHSKWEFLKLETSKLQTIYVCEVKVHNIL